MNTERLPYEELNYEQQRELFNEEVQEDLDNLLKKFDKNHEKSIDPIIFVKEQIENYRSVFEDTTIPKKIGRAKKWLILRGDPYSFKEDKWLPVRLIFYYRILGQDYDLKQIDNKDIKALRQELISDGDYYIENQISTETHFQFYQYLLKKHKEIDPNNIDQTKQLEINETPPLTLSQSIAILYLLREEKQFPSKNPFVKQGDYNEFIGDIIGKSADNSKRAREMADKLLGLKPKYTPTSSEARTWIQMLDRIKNVLEINKLDSLVDRINTRMDDLALFLK